MMVLLPSLPLKVVQSVDERQPVIDPLALRHERELPANESPLPMSALVRAPVLLPVRMPPKVVDPVPPMLTARVVVPDTTPVALVTRSELWILETVRLEVEADEAKKLVVLSAVDEAKTSVLRPPMNEVWVLGSK